LCTEPPDVIAMIASVLASVPQQQNPGPGTRNPARSVWESVGNWGR
jgi:hypothetical protein